MLLHFKWFIDRGLHTRHGLLARHLLLSLLVIASSLIAQGRVDAKEASAIESVAASNVPREANTTLERIKQGGPFAYPAKDGRVFANREQVLPQQPRGYYAEYTVRTPWTKGRGVRRIIAGKGTTGQFSNSGEYYYTDDHYSTFKRIVE